ncbi:outer membrane lipoprotein chaperone LolA [Alkalilimnicola ehrlichii]|uniref:outer membrane lipoprotein chaperone LolA n=1 Tax=Alkalilimnicola ehrlichii TaxID=351052 RepID=UPI003BA20295
MKIKLAFAVLLALCLSLSVMPVLAEQAATRADLARYYDDVTSLQGRFTQKTRDESGRVLEESSGEFWIERPDRFRWNYAEPWPQEIVSDGERLWVYDQDLDQVTVRSLADSLGRGPATLLGGTLGELEEAFELTFPEPGRVALQPREATLDYEHVLLRLEDGVPVELELEDGLGQITVLRLEALERDVEIDPGRFDFEPPEGADVIKAGGGRTL